MAKINKKKKQQNATASDLENTRQVFTLIFAKHMQPAKPPTTVAAIKPEAWIGGDSSHMLFKMSNIERP